MGQVWPEASTTDRAFSCWSGRVSEVTSIGSEKVRNDSQTTIRSVVDFEEAEIRLLDGNGLGDLAPVGNYVQFSGCEIREITGQKWS